MPKTNISYTKVGDYFIPNLTVPPEDDTRPIGVWGRRHYNYLKNSRKAVYAIMVMDNTLHTHLADINEQADEMKCTPPQRSRRLSMDLDSLSS